MDASRPKLEDGFIRRTFAAMVAGVGDAGIRALLRTAEPDGVFHYTFFKAVGLR